MKRRPRDLSTTSTSQSRSRSGSRSRRMAQISESSSDRIRKSRNMSRRKKRRKESISSTSSSESEEWKGRKSRARHLHEQLASESSVSSHTLTSEGSREHSWRSLQTPPRGEFNQLKTMVDAQLLHMQVEMSDMAAWSSELVADDLRQILCAKFEAFRQEMLQEMQIAVSKLQTSESEKAKQAVQQRSYATHAISQCILPEDAKRDKFSRIRLRSQLRLSQRALTGSERQLRQ